MVQQQNNSQVVKMAMMTGIVLLSTVAAIQVVKGQQEYVSAQTSLIITVHEDASVTLKTMDGVEIKGFANIEALSGANGVVDLIEQMELYKN